MPPAFPVANASTIKPNKSSLLFTPAAAPLSAKTKVPSRSSTTRKGPAQSRPSMRRSFITPTTHGPRPPRPSRLSPSGVDDRCKARIVIGRERADRPVFFGLGIYLRIVSSKEPVHRGTCHSAPKHPKSSLAIVGFVCSTEPSGKFCRNASTTFSVVSGSFVTDEYRSSGTISGGFGAPAAVASALTIRSMAASTCLRTPSSMVRTFNLMIASSGMTFSFVPACRTPTVTTAESVGATSRETIVCSLITVEAAMTTGSMLASGIEP